jgi:azurin
MKLVTKMVLLASLSAVTSLSHAACSFDVEVGDYLRFSATEMTVEKSCDSVTVNLKHTGKLPAKIMGHNWVLTKDTDVKSVASKGMGAGLAANYVPQGDTRVIAYSSVIGGGGTTSVTFSTKDLSVGGKYVYFCSFPGHSYGMRGTLNVKA